jgi:chaperonin GroES
MSLKITLLGDRVLVKREPKKNEGLILLPGTAEEKSQEGEVVAVGLGNIKEDGSRTVFDVKVGQKVVITKFGGIEIKLDGTEYVIFNISDLIAILG